MNNLYPISLNINHKLCIIVGGGRVALRRTRGLLESGAIIKIISPTIDPELKNLIAGTPNLSWRKTHYIGPQDLHRALLVFAATDNPSLNEKVQEDAHSLGLFTNIASNGGLSDFIIPCSLKQGDLQISVSTSGKVPGLSKAIKENLEETFTPEYQTLISILEDIRTLALKESHNKTKNRYILSDITANYLSILEDIRSKMDLGSVRDELLKFLK